MQLYSNNASSKLDVGISNVSLSVQVKSGDGAKFPNPTGGDFFLVTLSKVTGGIESQVEIVKVTARSGDVLTIIRAQEGTSAGVYAEDDFLQLRMTAATATTVEAHMNNTSNPHVVTKAQVGLGSADNTADADKPVSTAQSTALGLKYDKTGGTLTGNVTVNTGADSRVLIQSTGTTQGQFQTTAGLVRLASNNALPLVFGTNGVDRITLDSVGNGTFGASGATGLWKFQGNNTADLVMLESTDASATAAPDFVLYRNSASPAANDQLGVIVWRGKDSGAADQQYARIGVEILDPTAASEDADLWFETTVAGAAVERLRLSAAGAAFVGTITGTGGIQNTAVGNVTPSSGAFTTLTASGFTSFNDAAIFYNGKRTYWYEPGTTTWFSVHSPSSGLLNFNKQSGDTTVFQLSTGGAAVTGTLSATGTASTPVVVTRTGSTGVYMQFSDSSGSNVYIGNASGTFNVQTPAGGFSNKFSVSDAGVAVTGNTTTAQSSGTQASFSATSGAITAYLSLQDSGSGRTAIGNTNNSGGSNNIISFGFGAVSGGVPANTVMAVNQAGTVAVTGAVSTTATADQAQLSIRRTGATNNPGMNMFANETGNIVGWDTAYSVVGPSYSWNFAGTEFMRLDTAGVLSPTQGQIKFPATAVPSADANTLDDYEEGTWTPTQGAGITLVGTFSSSGTYTKIGRQVTVVGQVNGTTSVAVAANTVLCGGLPFVSAVNAMGSVTNNNMSNSGVVFAVGGNVYSTAIATATPSILFTVTYFV